MVAQSAVCGGDCGQDPHSTGCRSAVPVGWAGDARTGYRQRDRLGRLLTALAYNPFAIGLGLDEDTAAFIAPDNTVEVVGSGAITVVDPAGIEFSSMDQAQRNGPQTISRHGRPAAVIVSADEWARKTRRAGTLAEFLAESPLPHSGLSVARRDDDPRDPGL